MSAIAKADHAGQDAPRWLSLRDAAGIYAVSIDTLRRRIATGDLPAVKLGYRLIRVRSSDLDHIFRSIPGDRS